MVRIYDILLTENDINEIQKGNIVKRFAGEYILNIKREGISCPKCGRNMKKDKACPDCVSYPDHYCPHCDIEWDDCDLVWGEIGYEKRKEMLEL